MVRSAFRIQGREVVLPVEVRDASAGTALYAVPAAGAQRLVPGQAFEVVDVGGGQAQLVLGMIDYRDNDLGVYREVVIAVFVRPRGAGAEATGTYIYKLPVDQSFTQEAGLRIWGFPKTVEAIRFDYQEARVACELAMGGERVFRLSLARARGDADQRSELPQLGYTYIDGIPHVTRSVLWSRGGAVTPGGEGVELRLGRHPIARELAALGLPRPPLLSTWTEHQSGRFEAPEKL